ncbi:MAG TPA: MBL fold metallo-hydrolase [Gemmatimonadaceae bacterium]|nr:MBL fold metallo-hydrolase [Gemmatimonadaceae bacterium]
MTRASGGGARGGALRLRLWGVRGSIPAPGPRTVRYGGNTPCVELRGPTGDLLILDAGTGIRELGVSLAAHSASPVNGHILLTHAHWDHIQGLPFFAPLFAEGNQFVIWGSRQLQPRLAHVLRDQMAPEVFPVRFDQLAAAIEVREVGEAGQLLGECLVQSHPARHPGGALGYRVAPCNSPEASLVYLPDNELAPDVPYQDVPADWRDRLVTFARDAAVLVHDTMYTAEEYRSHRGWGHSTYEDAVALAIDANVGTLVLFHHEPARTDDELDALVEHCRRHVAARGGRLAIVAAAEGLELTI